MTTPLENKKKLIHQPLHKDSYIISAITITVLSLVFYILNIAGCMKIFQENNNTIISTLGTVGDYFGGILNPLLTFITIILLIRSIELQRADFNAQLIEQKEQKEEFKKQSEAQRQQAKDVRNQYVRSKKNQKIDAFERHFFSLLEQNNSFLNRDSFDSIINDLFIKLTYETSCNNNKTCKFDFYNIENVFSEPTYNMINTYLRFLYRFLKFLSEKDEQKIEGVDVHSYSDILRSVISERLLHIILINGLRDPYSDGDFLKYRNLLEKFHFFEHANLKYLAPITSYIDKFIDYSSSRIGSDDFLSFITDYWDNINNLTTYFLSYSPEAFDKNPDYLKNIYPALAFLVKHEWRPRYLLGNDKK